MLTKALTMIEKLLLQNTVEGTATNAVTDEAIYLGNVQSAKYLKRGWRLQWDVPQNEHISPFNRVILHSGTKLLGVLNLPPFRLDQATKLQVEVR